MDNSSGFPTGGDVSKNLDTNHESAYRRRSVGEHLYFTEWAGPFEPGITDAATAAARWVGAAGTAQQYVPHHEAIFGDVCSLDGFDSFTAAAVALDAGTARLQASVDGEVVTLDNPLTFRVRPGALRVIVP